MERANLKASDALDHAACFAEKMELEGISEMVRETFLHYYDQVCRGETGFISNAQIEPLAQDDIIDSAALAPYEAFGRQNLSNTVRIVLNGGLGTSMGLAKPKSLIAARGRLSFLDLILMQARKDCNRLVLMNSFHTHAATLAALKDQGEDLRIWTFLQNKFPKINRADLSPASCPSNPHLEWNPPGHGDIYTALHSTGTLDQLLQKKIRYAYISNCDNLGAHIDLGILGYLSYHGVPFMMEVAQKTPADVKGGHLAKLSNNRIILRESAQCPPDELDAFRDIATYRYFNTNSIWIDLAALSRLMHTQSVFALPLIINPKTVNPQDPNSPSVFQIETAMGAAISLFEGAKAVLIPRHRFFPVKKCNELMAVRSDRFELTPRFTLQFHPEAQQSHPHIELDSDFYGQLADFETRFPKGVPSLQNCMSLKIVGNVFFGEGIKILGDVVIANHSSEAAFIEDNSILEGVVNF
jgi:UTP--glucose-1-phosphate uridylyltransferase